MYRNLGIYAGESYSLTLQIENPPLQSAEKFSMFLDTNVSLIQKVTIMDQKLNLFRVDFEIPLNVFPGIHRFALRSLEGELLDGLSRHVRILPPIQVLDSVGEDRVSSLPVDITKQFGGISELVALSKASKSVYDPLKRGRSVLRSSSAQEAIFWACGSKFYSEMLAKVSIDDLDYSDLWSLNTNGQNLKYLIQS